MHYTRSHFDRKRGDTSQPPHSNQRGIEKRVARTMPEEGCQKKEAMGVGGTWRYRCGQTVSPTRHCIMKLRQASSALSLPTDLCFRLLHEANDCNGRLGRALALASGRYYDGTRCMYDWHETEVRITTAQKGQLRSWGAVYPKVCLSEDHPMAPPSAIGGVGNARRAGGRPVWPRSCPLCESPVYSKIAKRVIPVYSVLNLVPAITTFAAFCPDSPHVRPSAAGASGPYCPKFRVCLMVIKPSTQIAAARCLDVRSWTGYVGYVCHAGGVGQVCHEGVGKPHMLTVPLPTVLPVCSDVRLVHHRVTETGFKVARGQP